MHALSKLVLMGCLLGFVLTGATGCSESRKARRLAAAEKHFEAGDYEKAELEYQSVRQLAPMDPKAISRLGEIYYFQGKQHHASAFLQKAIETDPQNDHARLLLARVKVAFGRRLEAHEIARQVLAKDPGNVEALVLLADTAGPAQVSAARQLLDRAPANAKGTSGWHVAAGMLLAAERRLDEALKELNKATEANPNDHVAHQALGTLHFLKNDMAAADASLKRAADLAPLRSNTRITYIEFVRRTKGEAEAKALAEDLYKKAPDYVPILAFLSESASNRGDREEAGKLIDRLLALDPSNLNAVIQKGSLMILKQDTNAVAYFERLADQMQASYEAARRAENNRGATNLAGTTNTQPADPAKQAARTAADVQASNLPPQVLQKLGEAHLLVNDSDRALMYLNEAASRDTNAIEAVTLRDTLWIRRGGEDLAKAVRSLEQTVRRAPAFPNARLTLAGAYSMQGRPDLAAAQYQELARRNTNSLQFLIYLAEAQASATNLAGSRATLEKALVLNSADTDVHERLARLDLYEGKAQAALDRLKGQLAKQPGVAPLHYLSALVLFTKAAGTNVLTSDALQARSGASGDLQQAEAELRKAIELNPLYKQAVVALADVLTVSKRNKEAIDALVAFSTRTNDVGVLTRLALLQEQGPDMSAAAATYEKLISLAPTNAVALNNLANILANIYAEQPEKLDRAAELAKRAKDLVPSKSTLSDAISDTLGWILYRQKDYERALPQLQQAAQGLKDNAEVQIHFGLANYMVGNETVASNVLSRALQLRADAPNHDQARAALEILALNENNLGTASVSTLEKRLASVPGDPAASRLMGAAYEKAGDWKKAAAAYEQHARSARINALKAESMVKAAELYSLRLGQPAQALELLKAARPLDPQNAKLLKTMGRLLYQTGDPQWAATLLDEAARRGNDPEAIYELAMAYYSMGRASDAERRLQGVDAGEGEVKNRIARFLGLAEAAKDPAKAGQQVAAAQAILRTEPKYLPALHVLAAAEEQGGPTKKAAEAYEKLLAEYPLFQPAAKKAILLNAKLGNDDKAVELASKNKDISSRDAEVSETLGLISFKRGDFQAASRQLQAVPSKDPVTIASLQIARHRVRQRVDTTALENAVKAGLPKPLEEEAKQVLAGGRGGN